MVKNYLESEQTPTKTVRIFENYLEIIDDKSVRLYSVWLRDHCRCRACYDSVTHQRRVDFVSLAANAFQVDKASIGEDTLRIVWHDSHHSDYTLDWLQAHAPGNTSPSIASPRLHSQLERLQVLWTAKHFPDSASLPSISYSSFLSEHGLRELYENVLRFGISLVVDAPQTYEGTQAICTRVCLPQETVYGRFWKFSAGAIDHPDAAYTREALGAHVDTPYYAHTAGLQVFQCLEHTGGSGGETLLVDGFNCAAQLRKSAPSAFSLLTRTRVPYACIEPGTRLYAEEPIIRLADDDDKQHPVQFRFNDTDRAPLSTLTASAVPAFYDAYGALARIVRSSENTLWLKLRPGTVLFIDNWRVMHGRSAFTGKRVMCGCYLQRDDFMQKARVAGVLHDE